MILKVGQEIFELSDQTHEYTKKMNDEVDSVLGNLSFP